MNAISQHIYADDFIIDLPLDSKFMANPYHEFPFLIIRDFLSKSICQEIIRYTQLTKETKKAEVKQLINFSVVNSTIKNSIRNSKLYKLPSHYEEHYSNQFKLHQATIEMFFSTAITASTPIQAIEYTKGSFYIKHADDSNELVNEKGETVGFVQVAPERKLSSVLFLSSHVSQQDDATDFNGGELTFNYLCDKDGNTYSLKAKAGDIIIFPSNPIFSHEVRPITDGYRLTLVQWHNAII